MAISKNDWEKYQEKIGVWQERYIAKLLDEYVNLISDGSMHPSQRFWSLEKKIEEDKISFGVQCELVKSYALMQIYELLANGTINGSDLNDFSRPLKENMLKKLVENDRYLFPGAYHEELFPQNGDEVYSSGIFSFNISALLEAIEHEQIAAQKLTAGVNQLEPFASSIAKLNPDYINEADITRPLIFLEMAPDALLYLKNLDSNDFLRRGYVLADGNHRIAKAKLNGINELQIYLVPMEEHVKYLCKNYKEYAEYWNTKLKERIADYYGIWL